jgi:hypothetical protein
MRQYLQESSVTKLSSGRFFDARGHYGSAHLYLPRPFVIGFRFLSPATFEASVISPLHPLML